MTRNGNGDRRPLVVLTTVGSEDQGRAIAEALVEQEIAACVNILPGLHCVPSTAGRGNSGMMKNCFSSSKPPTMPWMPWLPR